MKRADRLRTRSFPARSSELVTQPEEPRIEKPADPPNPLSQIATFTKQMNWARVQSLAQDAVKSGQFTEDQVEKAIDAALPTPERAATLPLHRLAAVASIASPERRQQYATALRNYPGLETLSPDHKAQIAEHMQLIGLEA